MNEEEDAAQYQEYRALAAAQTDEDRRARAAMRDRCACYGADEDEWWDAEDGRIAVRRLEDLRAGRSRAVSAAEVERLLGLDTPEP